MANAASTPPAPLRFSEICRDFAPGWFAAVMGTGVLAMLTHALAANFPLLVPLAWGLHVFNFLLFGVLAVPWLIRWLAHREAALTTLRHPVQASFYATFPIAMLVLAAQCLSFGRNVELALLFWWPGVLLVLTFSFLVLFEMFSGEHVGIEHVTPAKFIPAVGLVVIPVAGGPLLAELQGGWRELAFLANLFGLGAGSLMYVGLLGLALQRKYLAKPAFGILTPTVWIHLAPIGVIPLSLLNVLEQLPFAVPDGPFLFLALLFWGAGLWWLVMASLLTLAARRRGMLPFALSWWGFIFPLGAFASLSLRLAAGSGIAVVHLVGLGAWGLMLVLWTLTFGKTLRGVASGAIFRPHP